MDIKDIKKKINLPSSLPPSLVQHLVSMWANICIYSNFLQNPYRVDLHACFSFIKATDLLGMARSGNKILLYTFSMRRDSIEVFFAFFLSLSNSFRVSSCKYGTLFHCTGEYICKTFSFGIVKLYYYNTFILLYE